MTPSIFIAALEYGFCNCQNDDRLSMICEDIHDAIKRQVVKETKTGEKIYKDAGVYISVGRPLKERLAAFDRIVNTVDALDCFPYDVSRAELKDAVRYLLFIYHDYAKAID